MAENSHFQRKKAKILLSQTPNEIVRFRDILVLNCPNETPRFGHIPRYDYRISGTYSDTLHANMCGVHYRIVRSYVPKFIPNMWLVRYRVSRQCVPKVRANISGYNYLKASTHSAKVRRCWRKFTISRAVRVLAGPVSYAGTQAARFF